MKDLHLKFKMNEGTSAYRTVYAEDEAFEIPSEEYLEWVEDLALKQLRAQKDVLNMPKLAEKLKAIERDFNDLSYLIDNVDSDNPDWLEVKNACDDLSRNF